jgi:hypothetical protein
VTPSGSFSTRDGTAIFNQIGRNSAPKTSASRKMTSKNWPPMLCCGGS